jgi:cytochrome c biogenesis protein
MTDTEREPEPGVRASASEPAGGDRNRVRASASEPAGGDRASGWARLPMIPGPWETAVIVWRRLRKMSTALVLLFCLALASIVATFIPQEPVIPQTVTAWRLGEEGPGRTVAQVFDAAELFDVFGSWWFSTLMVLLLVSLTGCLVPRYRAFARTVRRPPVAGRNLERLNNHMRIETAVEPEAALAEVDRALARRRFRRRRLDAATTQSGHAQLAAERGHWREGGNLLFHSAFYVLLVGVGVGQAFGFTGQINVVEGSAFTDTRIVYGAVVAGRYFGLDDHRGFEVRLDDFAASYHANGTADEFVSHVSVIDAGRQVRTNAPVRVNHPLTYDGMKLYQVRFGMAPHIIVRAGDTVIFDDRVMLGDSDGDSVWTGAAKVTTGPGDQMALDLALVPDVGVDRQGRVFPRSQEPNNPVLFADVWFGELGLERPVDASEFIRDGRPVASTTLTPAQTSDPLVGNLVVEFAELPMWSGFQVSHAPGRGVLLVAAGLLLGGLTTSLYGYRRRLWAEAWTGGDGTTTLVVAGVALQRKVVFAEAFAALTEELRMALPAATTRAGREVTIDAHHG